MHSFITLSSKIFGVPLNAENIFFFISPGYGGGIIAGGVNFKRATIAPYAACELLGTYEDLPNDYILVDVGSHMTTVSLIGEKALYASRFFEWGGDRITDRIIEKFNINETEAEKIKITYGLDKREMNFKAPVCTSDDGNGNEIKHYNDELNAIIKSELETFTKELNSAQDNLLEGYDSSYHNLPMILIGGGSMLNGFKEYLEPKVPNEFVKVVVPRSLGARNPTFLNCLGMILVNAKYPNISDDAQSRIPPIQRDAEK